MMKRGYFVGDRLKVELLHHRLYLGRQIAFPEVGTWLQVTEIEVLPHRPMNGDVPDNIHSFSNKQYSF